MVWGDVGPEGGGVGLEKEGGMEEGGWGVEEEGGGEVIICGQWDFAPPSFLSPQYLPHVQTQRLIKHTDDDVAHMMMMPKLVSVHIRLGLAMLEVIV